MATNNRNPDQGEGERNNGLVLKLREGQFILMEGARLRAIGPWQLQLLSSPRFVFGRQYMPFAEATTPLRRAYYDLQQAYAGPLEERSQRLMAFQSKLHALPADLRRHVPRVLDSGDFLTLLRALRLAVQDEENAR